MSVTIDNLETFFKRYGWEYQLTEDPKVVLSGFAAAEDHSFAVILSLSDQFVVFMTPYEELPAAVVQRKEFLAQLLHLNFSWPVAKLSLDDDDTLIISVEFSQDSFDYEHFAMGLDMLTEAVEELYTLLPKNDEADTLKRE